MAVYEDSYTEPGVAFFFLSYFCWFKDSAWQAGGLTSWALDSFCAKTDTCSTPVAGQDGVWPGALRL